MSPASPRLECTKSACTRTLLKLKPIALQETRHENGGPPWAKRQAADLDWRTQWSVEPPPDVGGKRATCGGTALLWRSHLRKSQALPIGAVAAPGKDAKSGRSVYGEQKKTDMPWCSDILQRADETPKPIVAGGGVATGKTLTIMPSPRCGTARPRSRPRLKALVAPPGAWPRAPSSSRLAPSP